MNDRTSYDVNAVNRWMDKFQGKRSLSGKLYETNKDPNQQNEQSGRKVSPGNEIIGNNQDGEKDRTNLLQDAINSEDTRKAVGIVSPSTSIETEAKNETRAPSFIKHDDIAYCIYNPGMNALLEIRIDQGAFFKAESGAMVMMSDTIKLKGRIDGGIGKAVVRKVLSREKFFFQYFTAPNGPGSVMVAPNSIGGIGVIEMSGNENYTVQKDGFLAATSGLEVGTKIQSISKGLFSGEGFFVVKVEGRGLLFINAFGNIHRIDIPAGQSITVDNKHLVAWPSRMKWEIIASSGILSTFTSGEVLVCKFTGPGPIYIQSRNPMAFAGWVAEKGDLVTKKQLTGKK